MICIKSPKSSEFAIFFKQKSLTMFISSCNNYLIEFLKKGKLTKFKVTPPTGFKPAIPGFEATEHQSNWMCKENCKEKISLRELLYCHMLTSESRIASMIKPVSSMLFILSKGFLL